MLARLVTIVMSRKAQAACTLRAILGQTPLT